MKFLLLLVFFIEHSFGNSFDNKEEVFITTGLTETAGSKLNKEIVGKLGEDNERRVAKFSKKYGIGLEDNEDAVTNEANIVRPCNLKDFVCIRKFLADNSKCSIAKGPVPDPLYLSQATVFLVYTNLTLTFTKEEVRGLSDIKIVEFNYNKKTDNLVLAIEIPTLNLTSPRTYVTYRRPARESIVKADIGTVEYYKVIITGVLPKIPKLRLDQAQVHAFMPDSVGNFYLGPEGYSGTDPDVVAEFTALTQSVPMLNREVFLFQAQLFLAAYVWTYAAKNSCESTQVAK